MKLYEITEEFKEIWHDIEDACDEGDGEIPPELKERLDKNRENFNEKLRCIATIMKQLQYASEACKAEEARLSAQRKAADKNYEWLRDYAKAAMDSRGLEGVQAGSFKLSLQNSPPALRIVDETHVPEEYWFQPPREINKPLLKAALLDGEQLLGAVITTEKHLRIR